MKQIAPREKLQRVINEHSRKFSNKSPNKSTNFLEETQKNYILNLRNSINNLMGKVPSKPKSILK